jgi:serine/threonine protein kinase
MAAPAAQEGTRPFGRYRLVEQIGVGGMAIVYRAVADGPEGFTRSFVIKRVLPELSQDPNFAKMLVAEARLSALLHHPGIVQVFELGQVDDEFYLAMKYIEGIDLVTLLNRCLKTQRAIPAGLVCFIIHALATALAYAHDLRDDTGEPLHIVHRDISPSNVMVTPTGAVKLLDFGIAKAADRVRDERTRTGKLKGKIGYLSPEQAEGEDEIDKRADIFCLGIVMHECLTMKRLFRADEDLATLKLVRDAKVPPPSSIVPSIDAEVDAVVLKMLARDPKERYAQCEEVAEALAKIVHRCEVDSSHLRRFINDLGPFDRKVKPLEPLTPSRELAPRRTRLLIGGAGALLLAVTGIVALAVRSPKPPPPPAPIEAVKPAPAPAPAPPIEVAKPPPPAPIKVPVRSDPPGAHIFVDGAARGTTPAVLEVQVPCELSLSLSGYKPAKELVTGPGELKVKLSRTGHGISKSQRHGKHKRGHQTLD